MKHKYINSAELVQYNANNRGKNVGDCVKRSISLAFGISYSETAKLLNKVKKSFGYPAWNIQPCYSKVIKQLGGSKYVQLDNMITVDEFADSYDPAIVYIVLCGRPNGHTPSHMVCIREGKIWDSWNSRNYIVYGYYVVEGDVTKPIVDLSSNMEELGELAEKASFETADTYATKRGWDYILTSDHSVSNFKIKVFLTIMIRDVVGQESRRRTYTLQIPFVVEPTQTLAEAKQSVLKVAKTKGYDRMYAINQQETKLKEEEETARRFKEAGGALNNKLHLDQRERKFLNTLPGWIKPLIEHFYIYGPDYYGTYEYALTFHPSPDDWRRSPNELIRLRAYTADELRQYINTYINSEYFDVAGEDYDYKY